MKTSLAEAGLSAVRNRIRTALSAVLRHGLLILASGIMLYPLLWMLASGFKPEAQIFTDLSIVPYSFDMRNFIDGWTALQTSFSTFYWNSFVIAIFVGIG